MDVQNGKMNREGRYLAVVMRFYPRFLKKERVDVYIRALAPPGELFAGFKALARKIGNHNSAFYQVRYEERFDLGEEGRRRLSELSEMAREQEVVLVCQCADFDRCHCDLLLLWAREKFQAPVTGLIFDYPIFTKRLEAGDLK
jgi:uncharacterized protein YeaO (DUF488 family)